MSSSSAASAVRQDITNLNARISHTETEISHTKAQIDRYDALVLAAKDAEERKLWADLLIASKNVLISYNNVLNTLLQQQNTTPGTHLPRCSSRRLL